MVFIHNRSLKSSENGNKRNSEKSRRLVLDYATVREKIEAIEDKRLKIFFAILYGTAARINEARLVTGSDILEDKERGLVLVTLPIEKNRKADTKVIPISKFHEPWLYNIIKKGMDFNWYIVDYSDRWLRKLCHDYFGVHPHALRHSRLTHLVKYFGFDEHRLTLYAGWSDPRPGRVYVHLRYQDIWRLNDTWSQQI